MRFWRITAGFGAADGNQSGVDGENLPAHGGGTSRSNRGPGSGRLRGQPAPGHALRELAPQPTRTRTLRNSNLQNNLDLTPASSMPPSPTITASRKSPY